MELWGVLGINQFFSPFTPPPKLEVKWLPNIDPRHRNTLVRVGHLLWVAGCNPSEMNHWVSAMMGNSLDETVSLVKDFSNYWVEHLLGIASKSMWSIPRYVGCEEAYFYYSIRRALPPPEPMGGDQLLEHVKTLYEEDRKDLYTEEETYQMAWDSLEDVKYDSRGFPTMISNKSCLEAGRAMGGRDYVSSQYLRLYRNITYDEPLPDFLQVDECDFPSPLFEEFLVLNQGKYQQSRRLIQIADHIRVSLDRPPCLAALDIPERGWKHRIPHIPEWHN